MKCKEKYAIQKKAYANDMPMEKEKYNKIFNFLEKYSNLITIESLQR